MFANYVKLVARHHRVDFGERLSSKKATYFGSTHGGFALVEYAKESSTSALLLKSFISLMRQKR